MLLLLKYDPQIEHYGEPFGGPKLFGDSSPDAARGRGSTSRSFVAVMGYLMASRLPMPKVGMTKNKLVSFGLLALVAQRLRLRLRDALSGDLLLDADGAGALIFLIWGQASAKARAMYPPPLFPKKDPTKPLIRPQADIEDIVLDEAPAETLPENPSSGV